MAIIKCPECGRDVSSQAKECVHCGCKIKVCPECGKALFETVGICDGCGYAFTVEKSIVKDSATSETKDEKTLKLEQRILSNAKIDKGMSIAKRVIDVLSILFFLVCVLTPVVFRNIPVTVQKIIMFFGYFGLMGMYVPFAIGDAAFGLYSTVGLSNWMLREGIDSKAYMKKYGFEAFERNADIDMRHIDRMESLRLATFFIDNRREVIWTVIADVLKIWRAALIFPLIPWIFGFIDILTSGASLTAAMFFTPLTISVAVLFTVFSIARFVIDYLQGNRAEAYIEKIKSEAHSAR